MNRSRRPARRLVLAGVGGLLAISGCASDPTDEEPAASSSDDVCAAADTAKASLDALLDTEVAQEGTDTLEARLETLKSDVEALAESGRSELAPESAAVEDSIEALGDVLAGLGQEPTTGDLAQVTTSLQAVRSSAEDLVAAVESTC